MKAAFLALCVLTLVAAAAMIGFAVWAGMPLQFLFLDAGPFAKLFELLLLIALIVVTVLGLSGRKSGERPQLLAIMTWAAPLFGLLGTARDGLALWQGMQASPATRLIVAAPSIAIGLGPLGLGLLVGAVAAHMVRPKGR